MQKVEGSSPFSRFKESPANERAFLLTRAPSSTLSAPRVKLWVKVR